MIPWVTPITWLQKSLMQIICFRWTWTFTTIRLNNFLFNFKLVVVITYSKDAISDNECNTFPVAYNESGTIHVKICSVVVREHTIQSMKRIYLCPFRTPYLQDIIQRGKKQHENHKFRRWEDSTWALHHVYSLWRADCGTKRLPASQRVSSMPLQGYGTF